MTEPLVGSEIFPPVDKYTYFDAASVGLMHKGAAGAINKWQQALAEDGTVAFDEAAEVEVLDRLNRAAGALFNVGPNDIAVASSETVLMSSLAWAVLPAAGSNIVCTRVGHPSSVYPWIRVAQHTGAEIRWADPNGLYIEPETLVNLIDERTSVVCLSHAEYSTGQIYDLARFAKLAHDNQAILVVDATQARVSSNTRMWWLHCDVIFLDSRHISIMARPISTRHCRSSPK